MGLFKQFFNFSFAVFVQRGQMRRMKSAFKAQQIHGYGEGWEYAQLKKGVP